MELGHLLTRSSVTYPEVSSKVCHDSFCQLGSDPCDITPVVVDITCTQLSCGMAFDSKMGCIRKCVTPWTNWFLLSFQQSSVCQASLADSEPCGNDLPPAETEVGLPHVHGQTYLHLSVCCPVCGSISSARYTNCPDENSPEYL